MNINYLNYYKLKKKKVGFAVAALLAATAAASVFAAGSPTLTTTSKHPTSLSRHATRTGLHTEKGAQMNEHKLAMATSLAKALGTTVDSITSQLGAGKSPKDIIKASGMDEATIKAQLEASHDADVKARLSADVVSGKITQEEADQTLTGMTERVGKGGSRSFRTKVQTSANL
jgi:hypothetical protein